MSCTEPPDRVPGTVRSRRALRRGQGEVGGDCLATAGLARDVCITSHFYGICTKTFWFSHNTRFQVSLPCKSCCIRCFNCMLSLNIHNHHGKERLSPSVYPNKRYQDSERHTNPPKVPASKGPRQDLSPGGYNSGAQAPVIAVTPLTLQHPISSYILQLQQSPS